MDLTSKTKGPIHEYLIANYYICKRNWDILPGPGIKFEKPKREQNKYCLF